MEISYRSISLKYESEEGEQIFCKGSGEDYLYTISYKAVGDQIEKVSLWFSEKQLLSDGEKERNFQYNESLFALDSFETESVKYCLDKCAKRTILYKCGEIRVAEWEKIFSLCYFISVKY